MRNSTQGKQQKNLRRKWLRRAFAAHLAVSTAFGASAQAQQGPTLPLYATQQSSASPYATQSNPPATHAPGGANQNAANNTTLMTYDLPSAMVGQIGAHLQLE